MQYSIEKLTEAKAIKITYHPQKEQIMFKIKNFDKLIKCDIDEKINILQSINTKNSINLANTLKILKNLLKHHPKLTLYEFEKIIDFFFWGKEDQNIDKINELIIGMLQRFEFNRILKLFTWLKDKENTDMNLLNFAFQDILEFLHPDEIKINPYTNIMYFLKNSITLFKSDVNFIGINSSLNKNISIQEYADMLINLINEKGSEYINHIFIIKTPPDKSIKFQLFSQLLGNIIDNNYNIIEIIDINYKKFNKILSSLPNIPIIMILPESVLPDIIDTSKIDINSISNQSLKTFFENYRNYGMKTALLKSFIWDPNFNFYPRNILNDEAFKNELILYINWIKENNSIIFSRDIGSKMENGKFKINDWAMFLKNI